MLYNSLFVYSNWFNKIIVNHRIIWWKYGCFRYILYPVPALSGLSVIKYSFAHAANIRMSFKIHKNNYTVFQLVVLNVCNFSAISLQFINEVDIFVPINQLNRL